MNSLTVREFIDIVHRSQLISKDRLIDALSDCKQGDSLPEQAEAVADFLREKGLLTDWQQQKLLQGKAKGFLLGDYCLLSHLGTGGMSSVFLGRHKLINRNVAIKILPAKRVHEGTYLERFEQEARATSRLSHPNVVRVFDIDQQGDTHFMVMEYVAGRDLKAMVKQHGPLPLDQVAHYMAQIGLGLEHTHQHGLIHRDIKPANLVVNDEDVVKILDLGLARMLGDADVASLTVENGENMMGTADFLSPEQARNAHTVDARADIYSLGCTLYYLLAGHAPFTEGTVAQRILMHQNQQPLDVRAIREDCPHAIADVCMTMLAKNPQDRIQSAGIVAKRMHNWLLTNGKARAIATYAVLGDAPMLPNQLHHSAPVSDLLVGDEEPSLVEARRARGTKRVQTPTGLWIFLGVLVLICLSLLLYVALR